MRFHFTRYSNNTNVHVLYYWFCIFVMSLAKILSTVHLNLSNLDLRCSWPNRGFTFCDPPDPTSD